MADVCAGEADESCVSVEVWQDPLVLRCQLGAMMSDGRRLFSAEALSSALQDAAGSPHERASEEAGMTSSSSKQHSPVSHPSAIAQARPVNGSSEVPAEIADDDHLMLSELDELLAGLRASEGPVQAVAKNGVRSGSEQSPAAGLPTFIGRPAGKQDWQAQHGRGRSKHRTRPQRGAALHPAFIRQRGKVSPGHALPSEREPQGRVPQPAMAASSDERSSADSADEEPRAPGDEQSRGAGAADRRGPCQPGRVAVMPDHASAAGEARILGQACTSASKAHEWLPVPQSSTHTALLAASRLHRVADGRSILDIWREAGGVRERDSNCSSQSAVVGLNHSAQPGQVESRGGLPEPTGGVEPDLPAILMQHFPGLSLAMAEILLQVSPLWCHCMSSQGGRAARVRALCCMLG